MIDPKAITTYAQYNEDLILLALLHDVDKGFYVDVGANYPVIDSVTKIFYDKGWNGINIEPIKKLHQQLMEARPKDINLQIGLGDKLGEETFREFIGNHGHSTFDINQKKSYGKDEKYLDYKVTIKTLSDVLTENKVKHIHFLKVDVEGYEHQVIAGNDWEKYRPEIICIEANHVYKDWRSVLTKHNFRPFISDGLNEYYVAKEAWVRTKDFSERIVKLNYHALKQHQQQSWSEDSAMLSKLHKIVADQDAEIKSLRGTTDRLASASRLSLSQQPLGKRIQRAGYGLTIDWAKYKKFKNNKD